jgi:hypothetical protein
VEVGVWGVNDTKPSGGFFSGGVGYRSRQKNSEDDRKGMVWRIKMQTTTDDQVGGKGDYSINSSSNIHQASSSIQNIGKRRNTASETYINN